jgi:hypothetical protein
MSTNQQAQKKTKQTNKKVKIKTIQLVNNETEE